MSFNHTKSNTMVNITISTLNNKKSSLKYCFIKELGFNFDEVEQFTTGEKANIKDDNLDNKEIDIVGLGKNNDPKVLIEIKVNIHEKLQDSQKINSHYQKFAESKAIQIYYIVPEEYSHQEEIGSAKYVTIKTWNEILEKTSEYDTIYSDAIENNVENVPCIYSHKNKAFMARVWEVLCRMNLKIDFSKENVMGNYSENEEFGNWVYTEENFGIGFYSDGVWLWYETSNFEKYKQIGFNLYKDIKNIVWKEIMKIDDFKNNDIKKVSKELKSKYDENLEKIKAIK
ncbi:hypothetical protein [Treponema zioleckii]|uniref:hypothetical protein n=1 Tax=Treponema zioleckii TaxID=331680 RepID=UPI00168AC9BE|nr:hypothetical protein [Treponema zioleckii]